MRYLSSFWEVVERQMQSSRMFSHSDSLVYLHATKCATRNAPKYDTSRTPFHSAWKFAGSTALPLVFFLRTNMSPALWEDIIWAIEQGWRLNCLNRMRHERRNTSASRAHLIRRQWNPQCKFYWWNVFFARVREESRIYFSTHRSKESYLQQWSQIEDVEISNQ